MLRSLLHTGARVRKKCYSCQIMLADELRRTPVSVQHDKTSTQQVQQDHRKSAKKQSDALRNIITN